LGKIKKNIQKRQTGGKERGLGGRRRGEQEGCSRVTSRAFVLAGVEYRRGEMGQGKLQRKKGGRGEGGEGGKGQPRMRSQNVQQLPIAKTNFLVIGKTL